MGHSKSVRNALFFANWCKRHGVDPSDAADLVTLADRAFKAGERKCNTGEDHSYEKWTTEFEKKAATLGFSTSWPGLCPTLKDVDGLDVYLPSF